MVAGHNAFRNGKVCFVYFVAQLHGIQLFRGQRVECAKHQSACRAVKPRGYVHYKICAESGRKPVCQRVVFVRAVGMCVYSVGLVGKVQIVVGVHDYRGSFGRHGVRRAFVGFQYKQVAFAQYPTYGFALAVYLYCAVVLKFFDEFQTVTLFGKQLFYCLAVVRGVDVYRQFHTDIVHRVAYFCKRSFVSW